MFIRREQRCARPRKLHRAAALLAAADSRRASAPPHRLRQPCLPPTATGDRRLHVATPEGNRRLLAATPEGSRHPQILKLSGLIEMANQPGNPADQVTQTEEQGRRGGAEAKKKKRKEVAPFGNYKHYYGYRLAHNIEEDPRFKLFNKDWFVDKDCLDIGCNNGLITINIAKKFHCRSILGVDIDHGRVADAEFHLKKEIARERHLNKVRAKDGNEPNVSEQAEGTSLSEDLQKETQVDGSHKKRSLSDVISFRCENFVYSKHRLPLEYYDTIVCLSVTKWIHLNWGDDGLLTFFAKIWRLLRTGGVFVVEPQPWKSYNSNRLVSETTASTYKQIMIFPRDFQDILLDKIGFRFVEHVTPSVPGSAAGFNRPVLVFRK